MDEERKLHTARFTALVYSLHSSAMVQLGKLAEPTTGEVRRDLDAARSTIDLLETLDYKLRNGLEDGERRMLDQVLTELRLNYIGERTGESSDTATTEREADEEGADNGGEADNAEPARDDGGGAAD
ncbi:MAG: DUF1844 domain-containing protein [Candidatus Coatesbacteria bacterium]|nr:DUF1844 domain-containing protein [Candidatus Coatesbacteria bacterium]